MRTYAAELYIYYPSNEIKKERLEKFFNSFGNISKVRRFEIKLEENGTVEEWCINEDFSSEICTVICCDVWHSQYNYNVCLDKQIKRIHKLLKHKLIDSSEFLTGFPKEKRWLVFPKFKKSLMGFEGCLLLYLYHMKYIGTRISYKGKNIIKLERFILENWDKLQSQEKVISLTTNKEISYFFEKNNTSFAQELKKIMKS